MPRTTAVLTVPAALTGHPLVYVASTPTGWEALPDGGPYDPLKDTCMVEIVDPKGKAAYDVWLIGDGGTVFESGST